jgi:hypothetical protein
MLAEVALPADPALNRLFLGASGGGTGSVSKCKRGCVIELLPARANPPLVVRRHRGQEREVRDRAERCGHTPLSLRGGKMWPMV